MHCEKGKKKKSNAVDYTTIYWDIHWSISKTLQDPVSRLLRMSRHPFQSDNIYFLRDSSHSHISLQLVGFVCSLCFFFFITIEQHSYKQTCPMTNQPSGKFEICPCELSPVARLRPHCILSMARNLSPGPRSHFYYVLLKSKVRNAKTNLWWWQNIYYQTTSVQEIGCG